MVRHMRGIRMLSLGWVVIRTMALFKKEEEEERKETCIFISVICCQGPWIQH